MMNNPSRNTYGQLHIKKRSPEGWMILLVVILPFLFGLLFEVFRLPDFLRFSIDAFLAYFAIMFVSSKRFEFKKELRPFMMLVVLFFVYTIFSYLLNFQSPFYFIWGARNNFRFYIAFFAFAIYINMDEVKNILKLFDIFFWLNFFVSIVQFFLFGIQQDDLGGLFGSSGGTNGYTLIFFGIVVAKSLLATFNGREKIFICVLKSVASLIIAALAEMKFYYVLFIIILIITSVLTRFSMRKFSLILVCIVAIAIGSTLLTFLFKSGDFLSFESIWEAAIKENYSSEKDLNRLSAIVTLANRFFSNAHQQLIGLGLGNCDVSDVSIFNTPFYNSYGFLHYTWFTAPMIFLETGIIGLLFYLSFFIFCMVFSLRQVKMQPSNSTFCQLSVVFSIVCIIVSFYNSSLRIEAGYMAYFVLALPFISSKEQGRSAVEA